ncbi:sensor histidine kinase [Streptomyces sp. NPDC020141]|uniref:sensor histidine kinase n=1 Tax=Streptomyces sp. NPDC020141 TaxID=3365065 RepID=UPI0037A1D4CF
MNVSSRILAGLRAGWAWLGAPEHRSPRRGAPVTPRRGTGVELVLALVLALLAAGIEQLLGKSGPWVVSAALGAGALSLLRRRLPAPVLIVTAALSVEVVGLVLVQIVVGWSAGRRIVGALRALAAFTGAYLAFMALVALTERPELEKAVELALLLTLAFLATTVVPGLASRHWGQRKTLLHALHERNAQLLWERQMIADQARLVERQRIAQDMHDSLGHQLALIAVHTGALEVDPELTGRQREAVGVLRNASVTAMHELREVVGILRDGVRETPAPVDETGRAARGAAGVGELVEAARAAGSTVELRHSGETRPLAAAADHAAYRIVQEALTNAFKHAPGAPIEVELRYEPDSLVVEIVSGPAAAPGGEVVSGGQGLTGLRERARLVGGMVHAGAFGGGGFRVAGVLPYGVVEAAPLAAEEDFPPPQPYPPQPRPDGVYADGVPVMNWGATGWPPPGAPGTEPVRRRFGSAGLGCVIAAVAVAVMAAATIGGLVFLVDSMDEGMIDRAEYDQVEVGESEDSVRDRLPTGDTVATTGLSGKGPKRPHGSQCLVLMSSEMSEDYESEPVFRFCFRDGLLVEKKAYDVTR